MKIKAWKEEMKPLNEEAIQEAKTRWKSIAKPLHSLGKLEEILSQIAGIKGRVDFELKKKALVVFCSDNGVVEEGVTQTGQEVTGIVAENFLRNKTSAALMCRKLGVSLFPIDIGMIRPTQVPDYHIQRGTRNIAKEPAMTREDAMRGIEVGISWARKLKREGYHILATGEMGIGNTTTSAAIASVLLGVSPRKITGRGAGLSDEGLERKIQVIQQGIRLHRPQKEDGIDVLQKLGGFDIAGLTGLYLGSAMERIPIVIDGFISAVAALLATRIAPLSREYMIASHTSTEPGMEGVLKELGKNPCLHCDMSLGEGTGAVALFPLLELGWEVFQKMSTFEEIQVKEYEEFQ